LKDTLTNDVNYTVLDNKITGNNCLEFVDNEFPYIKCKFYDKIVYYMETASLTS